MWVSRSLFYPLWWMNLFGSNWENWTFSLDIVDDVENCQSDKDASLFSSSTSLPVLRIAFPLESLLIYRIITFLSFSLQMIYASDSPSFFTSSSLSPPFPWWFSSSNNVKDTRSHSLLRKRGERETSCVCLLSNVCYSIRTRRKGLERMTREEEMRWWGGGRNFTSLWERKKKAISNRLSKGGRRAGRQEAVNASFFLSL